jgi:rhodanese-related sulfurtransferase
MNDITAEELKERMDKGEQLNIIDVREEHENEEFNIGGQLIPLGTLPDHISELDNLKEEEVIVYCRSGNRSGQAKMFMSDMGFTRVRNLVGGMLNWQAKIN